LEKRLLASLEARKVRREQRKREKGKAGFHTGQIVAEESSDMQRARTGFGRRKGSSSKQNGLKMQMTEYV